MSCEAAAAHEPGQEAVLLVRQGLRAVAAQVEGWVSCEAAAKHRSSQVQKLLVRFTSPKACELWLRKATRSRARRGAAAHGAACLPGQCTCFMIMQRVRQRRAPD